MQTLTPRRAGCCSTAPSSSSSSPSSRGVTPGGATPGRPGTRGVDECAPPLITSDNEGPQVATVTVWRFDIAIGADEAVNTLHDLTKQQRITVQDLRLRRTLALPMMLTNDSTRVNMSDPERAGADHHQ